MFVTFWGNRQAVKARFRRFGMNPAAGRRGSFARALGHFHLTARRGVRHHTFAFRRTASHPFFGWRRR